MVNDYHVKLFTRPHRLAIYAGKEYGDGTFKYKGISDDRTDEIILSVIALMKSKIEKNEEEKGFAGYNLPGEGKLVFIKEGYDFSVDKHQT